MSKGYICLEKRDKKKGNENINHRAAQRNPAAVNLVLLRTLLFHLHPQKPGYPYDGQSNMPVIRG